MEEDVIIVHHVSDHTEEEKEKIIEVKVERPGILTILSVIAYFIMGLNFLVGIFMNISYFDLITFARGSLIDNVAYLTKIMLNYSPPGIILIRHITVVFLGLLPFFGLIGLFLTRYEGDLRFRREKPIVSYDKLGFWIFTISQLVFLAIPLNIWSSSTHYSIIILSLLHTIIIIPVVIAYLTYFYYFRKL